MVLIFAQLPPVPVAPVSPWQGIVHQWIGWDGSVWDLSTGAEGVILTEDGVEGLHFPKIEKFKSTSRSVPGSRIRGSRTQDRDVFWRLLIHDRNSSQAFAVRANAFFRTLHPERAGTWRVGVGGQFRELSLTGTFGSAHQYAVDPLFNGWAQYGVTAEAVQPYWVGERVERGPWRAPDPQDFRPASGEPMFYISSAAAFADATIPNPGDVAAYPIWTVHGPLAAGVELGVSGDVIEVPFEIDDGATLVIDTDPRNVSATLDGEDVSAALGFQPLEPVQPAESAALVINATGSGSVEVSLTPLYYRAF